MQLTAPGEEGGVISRWRAQAADGTLFGDEVHVLVVVDASPQTPTPLPTATSPWGLWGRVKSIDNVTEG